LIATELPKSSSSVTAGAVSLAVKVLVLAQPASGYTYT
jgi:hypothetical protein